MKIKNILGITAFLGAALAAGVSILAPAQERLIYGVWAFSGAAAIGWVFFARHQVVSFFTRKSTRYGANFAFVVFLVLGILVFVNVLAKEYSLRKDITRSGLNSLSPQSVKVVKELGQDVKVYYFHSLMERERQEPLFKNYAYHSRRFQYEFVDTARRPTFTQSMEVKRNDTVILQLGDTNKRVKIEGATEEKVTNGLIKLHRTKDQVVYFTVGHGERELSGAGGEPLSYTALKGELEKQGYVVKELNLLGEGKVPGDAGVVIVAGPKSAFFPKELEILSAWMQGGGRALFAVDLDVVATGLTKGSRQVAELLKPYGVDVSDKMLVDPTSRQANVEPQILLGFAGSRDHPITKDFPSSALGIVANFFFPITTHLTHEKKENVTVSPLARTSQLAWAEHDWNSLKKGVVKLDKSEDIQGVMDLAYAIESGGGGKGALTRLAVFAASTFATNGLLDKAGNRDFFLNTVAWLASDESLISIRPRDDSESQQIQANANVMNFVFLLTVFVLPLVLVAGGVTVWWRRTKQ